jgi:hypothetical protein
MNSSSAHSPIEMIETTRVVFCVVAAWLTATLLLTGCDLEGIGGTNPGPGPELQTQILRVEVDPNPVAVGDTVVFTCVIADSTDERFEFKWLVSAGDVVKTPTKDRTALWIAPDDPGEYRHTVTADNDTDGASPSRSFTVTVVDTTDEAAS